MMKSKTMVFCMCIFFALGCSGTDDPEIGCNPEIIMITCTHPDTESIKLAAWMYEKAVDANWWNCDLFRDHDNIVLIYGGSMENLNDGIDPEIVRYDFIGYMISIVGYDPRDEIIS